MQILTLSQSNKSRGGHGSGNTGGNYGDDNDNSSGGR